VVIDDVIYALGLLQQFIQSAARLLYHVKHEIVEQTLSEMQHATQQG
jgi:hypothetical protein